MASSKEVVGEELGLVIPPTAKSKFAVPVSSRVRKLDSYIRLSYTAHVGLAMLVGLVIDVSVTTPQTAAWLALVIWEEYSPGKMSRRESVVVRCT